MSTTVRLWQQALRRATTFGGGVVRFLVAHAAGSATARRQHAAPPND